MSYYFKRFDLLIFCFDFFLFKEEFRSFTEGKMTFFYIGIFYCFFKPVKCREVKKLKETELGNHK